MQNRPPPNPYLYADSVYPIIHFDSAQSDSTDLPMWRGSHVITDDQIDFWPLSWAVRGISHKRYADGRDVILTTGNAEVAKFVIDHSKLRLVNQLVAPGQEEHYASSQQTAERVAAMDKGYMNEEAFLTPLSAYLEKFRQGTENAAYGAYSLTDLDGFLYTGYGTSLVKYGDVAPGDAGSELHLAGQVDLRDHMPPELAATVSRFIGINMTYDGYIVVAMPGVVGIVSRDLTEVHLAPLTGEAIDNSISVDDHGGLYVVTSKYMRKLVWDGKQLSDGEADGAWKEPYPYAAGKPGLWLSRGAGATPTCMGFGEDEDHLVALSDAGDPVNFMAFWRDDIPGTAHQVEGTTSRRMANSVRIGFPVITTIEWSPQVCGSRVMTFASDFPDPVLTNKELAIELTLFSLGYTRKAPRGAQCFEWNSDTKRLESRWLYTDRTLCWTLSPVSAATGAVYLNTLQDGDYKIIGLDWQTGSQIAEIQFPDTYKLNTCGQFVFPARSVQY